jgi:hypothetical protein
MTNEEVKRIAKEVSREVLSEMIQDKKDKRLHNTRLLMRNYNSLKEHINSKSDGSIEIKVDIDDEVLKTDYIWLESVARSKTRTAKMMQYVDSKLEYIKNKFKEKKEYEKYRAFEMYFIEYKSNEEIFEELGCGKNSPRRWTELIIKELSILLWGIDALGI